MFHHLLYAGMHPGDALMARRYAHVLNASTLQVDPTEYYESPHRGAVPTLDIDPSEDRYLLVPCADRTLSLYDTHLGHGIPLVSIPPRQSHPRAVSAARWFPFDNALFFSSSYDGSLYGWDANTCTPALKFALGRDVSIEALACAAFSAAQPLVACACAHKSAGFGSGASSGSVRLCDPLSGSVTHTLGGHTGAVLAVAFSPREPFVLLSASEDGSFRIWDIRRAGPLRAVADRSSNAPMTGVHYTPDGTHVLVAAADPGHALRLFRTFDGARVPIKYAGAGSSGVRAVQLALDATGTVVFHPGSNSLGRVEAFQVHSGRRVGQGLVGHVRGAGALACCWSRQECLFTAGADGTVLRWRPTWTLPTAAEEKDEAERKARIQRLALTQQQQQSQQSGQSGQSQQSVQGQQREVSASVVGDQWSDDEEI